MAGGGDDTQLWMVPYADLMSMMVILFMALFGYAYQTKGPELERTLASVELSLSTEEKAGARERLKVAEQAVELKEQLNKLGLSEMGLNVTTRRIKLTLPAPILFAEGSERLGPAAAPVLEAVSTFLAASDMPVVIEGHTDNIPIAGGRYRSNWELSAARAYSVVDYFISKGLPASRFSLRGFAEHRPVAPNDSAEGRRLNRRIEISLIRRQEAQVEADR